MGHALIYIYNIGLSGTYDTCIGENRCFINIQNDIFTKKKHFWLIKICKQEDQHS